MEATIQQLMDRAKGGERAVLHNGLVMGFEGKEGLNRSKGMGMQRRRRGVIRCRVCGGICDASDLKNYVCHDCRQQCAGEDKPRTGVEATEEQGEDGRDKGCRIR